MDLWKDIPNFEGLYQASIDGKIRSVNHIRKNGTNKYLQKGKILKFNKNSNGYLQVRLSKSGTAKTFRVNRLIALTFIENPLNKQTEHMHKVLGVPYADCSKLLESRWKNETLGA